MHPQRKWLLALALVACRGSSVGVEGGAQTDGGAPRCTPTTTAGTGLRLLTRAEYDHTVRDLLGLAPDANPSRDFPKEPLLDGFDNTASLLSVSTDGLTRSLEAAEALAADTVARRRSLLVPCFTADATCASQFIDGFGLRAFRRPLTTEERSALTSLFSAASADAGFDTGIEWTVESVLQAPQFLYRDEQPLGPPTTATVHLSGFELATRLSYFLWATTPDDELLAAAGAGSLDTAEGLVSQAQRLLADPRALEGELRFFALWLYLDGVETTEKNPQVYPQASRQLAQAWRRSLELYLTDVLEKEGTLEALLSKNVLFTNDLMSFYGLSAPTADFVRHEPTGTERKGLLAQPGFLGFKAQPDSSSPVRRGTFVLDKLVCEPPQPPPPGLVVTPPAPSTSKTTRERFVQHSVDPMCHACHQLIDPPGFTFEHYDGMGVWREEENGQPIDATGGIVSAQEASLTTPVDGLEQLQSVLAKSRQVHDCVAKGFYQFALGRSLTDADSCDVALVSDAFAASGGNFKALMLAIVESQAFQQSANPEATP